MRKIIDRACGDLSANSDSGICEKARVNGGEACPDTYFEQNVRVNGKTTISVGLMFEPVNDIPFSVENPPVKIRTNMVLVPWEEKGGDTALHIDAN